MKCPKPNITNGMVRGNLLTYGSVVEIVCNVGYQYNGETTGKSECVINETDTNPHWSGNPHTCERMFQYLCQFFFKEAIAIGNLYLLAFLKQKHS